MLLTGRYDLLHRRSRIRHRRRHAPPGSPPGTLVIAPDAAPPTIHAIGYGPDGCAEEAIEDLDRLHGLRDEWPVLWVNVDGFGDHDLLVRLGDMFAIHRLVLEDAVNLGQRAKAERYTDQMFVVARMPRPGSRDTEQLSLLLTEGVVITMQESVGDVFGPIRDRIRTPGARIRSATADFLAYALLDAVVDGYFPVLEGAGDELDALEDEVFHDPDRTTLARLHGLKRDFVNLRKAIWPHREMVSTLQRDGAGLITDETQVYLRDAYDHVVRIIDLTEALREVSADLLNSYLSMVSNRMNEVMKVLTIIATIFIPLSFIAGVYGMNFDSSVSPWNMPELGWRFGYPAALLLMATVAGALVVFMLRRKWL